MAHGDITHVEIPVNDFAKATAFYSGLFGWQIAEAPGYEGYPMWRAPNQISGGALVTPADGFVQPRSYVEVDSIDEVVAATPGAGGTVVVPKSEISPTSWWAVISDSDGNTFGLYEGTTESMG